MAGSQDIPLNVLVLFISSAQIWICVRYFRNPTVLPESSGYYCIPQAFSPFISHHLTLMVSRPSPIPPPWSSHGDSSFKMAAVDFHSMGFPCLSVEMLGQKAHLSVHLYRDKGFIESVVLVSGSWPAAALSLENNSCVGGVREAWACGHGHTWEACCSSGHSRPPTTGGDRQQRLLN